MARIVTDAMLGKLTRYLRMAGHDVVYAPDRGAEDDEEVVRLVDETGRLLITRDTSFGCDAVVIESLEIEGQLREVIDAGVEVELGEPRRCSDCNGVLRRTDERPEHAPESVDVWRCSDCGKHYWKGSHWDDVRERVEEVKS